MRAHQRCTEQAAPSNDGIPSGRWRSAFEQAATHWDWGPLSFRDFCVHLNKLGYSTSLPAELASVYLCAGCTSGVAGACQTLERLYFPDLQLKLRNRCPAQVADDIMQDARERLLVGPFPKIATYRGNGPLAGWLRTVILNLARDRMRAEQAQRLQLVQVRALDAVTSDRTRQRSPEELYAEAQLGAAYRHALGSILRSMSSRDQQLLRHSFVSNLNIDEIGAMYGVDRSTAARWLHRTLETTRTLLRRALRDLLGDRGRGNLPALLPAICAPQGSSLALCLELVVGEWFAESPASLR